MQSHPQSPNRTMQSAHPLSALTDFWLYAWLLNHAMERWSTGPHTTLGQQTTACSLLLRALCATQCGTLTPQHDVPRCAVPCCAPCSCVPSMTATTSWCSGGPASRWVCVRACRSPSYPTMRAGGCLWAWAGRYVLFWAGLF
jgi:hypothetical protein